MFWLSGAWLAGIQASPALPLQSWQWLILSGLCLAGWLLLRPARPQRLLLGLLLASTLGAARFQPRLPNQLLVQYHGLSRGLTVRGRVIDDPARREGTTALTVSVEAILAEGGSWQPVEGLLLADVDPFFTWSYGDRVELRGNLKHPPTSEDFDYRAYLARRGIHSVMTAGRAERLDQGAGAAWLGLIYRLRASLLASVQRLFPEPEASLLAGILLGVESGISTDVRRAFDRTGTTHVIAISGFNISIIAGLFLGIFGRWLGARRGALAAGAGIAVYTLLVGADAAVVRAAVMAGLSLTAQRLGRQSLGFASLGSAGVVMTAIDPQLLWDVSFQLSFAATLGLLVYGERFRLAFVRMLRHRWGFSDERSQAWAGPTADYFLLTLAAQLTTLPLILYHFSRLSLVAPVANLVILPVQPAVMIMGGLAASLGAVSAPLGRAAGALAWPFPAFTIRAVELLAGLPLASLSLPPMSPAGLAGLYGALLLLTGLAGRPTDPDGPALPYWLQPVFVGALALGTVLAWQQLADLPDGRTRVTLLATHPGDGLLIETGSGRRILIDGGASALALGEALDRRHSPFDRSLDWLIVTQASEQAIGGIARLVERYAVGGAIVAAAPSSNAYRRLAQELAEMGRPLGPAASGMQLELGDGALLEFALVSDDDLVMTLSDGSARLLLAPRAASGWIDRLAAGYMPGWSAVLLPEAGDSALTPPADLLQLDPALILLSVDPAQVPDRPPRSLLEALSGRTILRTDQHGWIELATDGQHLWVSTGRVGPTIR